MVILSFASLSSKGQTLKVAVASNAHFPMQEIKEAFEEANHGVIVQLISGSSGQLFTQIEHGAPFDVFLAADTFYNSQLYLKKIAILKPEVYAQGVLVLWTEQKKVTGELPDMLPLGDQKICIANPSTAPYGKAAKEVLQHLKVYDRYKEKMIIGESIAQVNNYIHKKVVDAAFTSKSSVLSEELYGIGAYVEVNDTLYSPILQSAALLTNKPLSLHFYKFLFTTVSEKIFKKYGYK